eukprot:TRINITY_DN4910_c0_g1_i1.p1 TRINITY_DN4910_c0_g1~~TRINITY_DN4910_c0_g1_i1.p1  ORF type:complete len:638 (-),score=134.43 TRINITY_DN4910_c0_g1_i1:82-1938(-)
MSEFQIGIFPEWNGETEQSLHEAYKTVFGSLPNQKLIILPKHDQGLATPEIIDSCDALLVLEYYFPKSSFEGLKRLSCISRWGVGFDRIDTNAANEAGVSVTIVPRAVRRSVAEANIGFIFALAKGIRYFDVAIRDGKWRTDDLVLNGVNLEGKVLGNIGMGNIGCETCHIANGVGFGKILGYDPFVTQQQVDYLGVKMVDLDTLLKESDFITLNVLLNDKTHHMISQRELSLLKPTAYIVNMSRGPVIDEAALIQVLKDGKIAGAGLDVFEKEPISKDNPLLSMSNVILSPHIIARTKELLVMNSVEAFKNIKSIYDGKVPKYLANPAVKNQPNFLERISKRMPKGSINHYTIPTLPYVKPNLLKKALLEERVPIGHMIWEFGSRGIAQIAQNSKLDFVVIDMEHSGFGLDTIVDLLALFRGTTVTTFVRVPISTDYTYIARVMDAGAQGIMAPNVKTAAQAKFVLDSMKYSPLGHRGIGFGKAHTNMKGPTDPKKYMEESNYHSTFICQIESQEGLDNLDEIASIDGVDVLWVGHFDLSSDLGIIGQFDHPKFIDACKKVAQVGNKYSKGLGVQPNSLPELKRWLSWGYNVISWGSDSVVYQNALTSAVGYVRSIA